MTAEYKVYLAPMEGLADPPLRKVLCRHGGYDWCFTEFIRVTDEGLNKKTLIHDCPELLNGGKTADGTPCRVQLLGDNPDAMADAAAMALSYGTPGVDINFGCPSRFVHHSGSMLLKEPELMHDIVEAVRDKVAGKCLLSVKVRDGFEDKKEAPVIVKSVGLEGVDEITVHCRTRKDLYKKDALDWTVIKPLHEIVPDITMVANGDIVSKETAEKCRDITGCTTLMVGRGGFMMPNIGKVIKGDETPYDTVKTLEVMREVAEEFVQMGVREKIVLDRAKQFLSYARLSSDFLRGFFKTFCHCADTKECFNLIDNAMKEAESEA